MESINKDNFFIDTFARFTSMSEPERRFDYKSDSGSKYWYTAEGIYRSSDHWSQVFIILAKKIDESLFDMQCGYINSCFWTIDVGLNRPKNKDEGVTGFCNWGSFLKILHFINPLFSELKERLPYSEFIKEDCSYIAIIDNNVEYLDTNNFKPTLVNENVIAHFRGCEI